MLSDSEQKNSSSVGQAKRIKTTDTRTSSLLVDTPDIMKNVYSFLSLKEALEMRRTCRHLRANDCDLFQYCVIAIVDKYGFRSLGHGKERLSAVRILCNLGSAERLRAALCNKTLPSTREGMLWDLVRYAKTDDGWAVSLLLEDEACRSLDSYEDPCDMLDTVLKKDFSAMAAVLQGNKAIQAQMKMCATCSVNVGAYKCSCHVECVSVPPRRDGRQWNFNTDDLPHDYSPPKYCRECVLASKSFRCNECSDYMCPQCTQAKNFHTCRKCKSKVCRVSWEGCSAQCHYCRQVLCASCNRCEDIGWDGFLCIHFCYRCGDKHGHILKDDPWSDEEDY